MKFSVEFQALLHVSNFYEIYRIFPNFHFKFSFFYHSKEPGAFSGGLTPKPPPPSPPEKISSFCKGLFWDFKTPLNKFLDMLLQSTQQSADASMSTKKHPNLLIITKKFPIFKFYIRTSFFPRLIYITTTKYLILILFIFLVVKWITRSMNKYLIEFEKNKN